MNSKIHAPSATKRLDELKPGQSATIWALCTSAESHHTERLMALGFVPGTTIEVLRRAPLGDPTEYALRGTRLSLRRDMARAIILETSGAQDEAP